MDTMGTMGLAILCPTHGRFGALESQKPCNIQILTTQQNQTKIV